MSPRPIAPETACHASRDSASTASDASPDICVLGIGNLLWADEGFGVRCLEALQARHRFPARVQLIDGGTQGLYLIQFVQSARRLLIFDAIDYGLAPGTLKLVRDDAVPRFMGAKKMSLHQTGFQEVLSLAQLTGHYPEEVLLIGCQPEELDDYGGSLRPAVKAAMAQALDIAVAELTRWGAPPLVRTDDDACAATSALALSAYEAERPSALAACREGDARFFPSGSQD